MARKIYQIHEGNRLEAMVESPYLSEKRFQELLARHPDLLANDQIDDADPRRFVLVAREIGIPTEEGASDRWSLDHLFLDQDGIPTLVEVRRSADPRLRREVVGQMLDYAANAVVYWPVDVVRARFEERCKANGQEPDDVLTTLLTPEETIAEPDNGQGGVDAPDLGHFWQEVETNLQAGRIRLLFVADQVPQELRRVVEFLNAQMRPAQVLAVEVKQYEGGRARTLVPSVIGHTTRSAGKKPSVPGRQWDEQSFLEALAQAKGAHDAEVARKIIRWAERRMPDVWWGRGTRAGGFMPGLNCRGSWHQLIEVWTYGQIEILFQYMKTRKNVFSTESARRELLARLNQVSGVRIAESKVALRPSIPLAVLYEEAALEQFLTVLDWAAEQIRSVDAW